MHSSYTNDYPVQEYKESGRIEVVVSYLFFEKDGVGLRGVNMQKKSRSMSIHDKRSTACFCMWDAFSSHCEGIRKISLEVVQLKDEPCMLTSFGSQMNPF